MPRLNERRLAAVRRRTPCSFCTVHRRCSALQPSWLPPSMLVPPAPEGQISRRSMVRSASGSRGPDLERLSVMHSGITVGPSPASRASAGRASKSTAAAALLAQSGIALPDPFVAPRAGQLPDRDKTCICRGTATQQTQRAGWTLATLRSYTSL